MVHKMKRSDGHRALLFHTFIYFILTFILIMETVSFHFMPYYRAFPFVQHPIFLININ